MFCSKIVSKIRGYTVSINSEDVRLPTVLSLGRLHDGSESVRVSTPAFHHEVLIHGHD